MIRFRKGVVYLLSLVLLVSLIGAAFASGANQTLGKPKKVEAYLAQSKLYDHFVAYTADQAKKSEGDTDQSGSVSLGDAAVQQAAKSAFPAQLIEQSVNSFINANYAWLEGRTATPEFKIDLSTQKATFAQQVGQYVKNYTASLPACTPAQAAQEVNVDPLAATCLQAGVTPEAVGTQVTQRLTSTGDFLSNPVITASSVNPKGNPQSKPYYEKLAKLPKLYRVGTKLPYAFGILSLLCLIGIVFISLTRRKGVRRIAIVLLIAGILLIAWTFTAGYLLKKVEHRVFNSASVGPLQQSLTDFAHRVVTAMARTNLWFGIGFVVLALVIIGALARTRQKSGEPKAGDTAATAETPTDGGSIPLIKARKRLGRLSRDSIMPLGAKPGGNEPEKPVAAPETAGGQPAKPKRRKRPRLIQ